MALELDRPHCAAGAETSMIRVVTKSMEGPFQVVEGTDAAQSAIERWRGGRERIWLDLISADAGEVDVIRRQLHFDEHSLEDAVRGDHPPKVEEVGPEGDRPAYMFVVAVAPTGETEGALESIALFLKERLLITFHSKPSVSIDEALSRLLRDPSQTIGRGIEFTAHAVLDEMVDEYDKLLDSFDARIERLEGHLEKEDTQQIFPRVLRLRREASLIGRHARAMRDVMACLSREGHPLVKAKARLAFRDIYDHVVRANDRLENQREAIYSIRDAHLALANHRMNEVMKALTVVAVISGSLAVLTGLLGMNYQLPFQEHPNAFWASIIAMAVISSSIIAFFRWRRWI
ncbi:MAG: magnesium transporter CorA family protein [Planctomycetes bacterium]|nr:magnesium transporter CorA family protein [Planctomycetota bacterium]